MSTTSPIDVVLGRLPKVTRNATRISPLCPAHDDRTPSLSISVPVTTTGCC